MISKVLVTGSTGFIGRHLVPKLLTSGFHVRVATRTSSSPFPGVEIVEVGDYLGTPDWNRTVAGVDAVVHLAARVHVMRDEAGDPLKEFQRMNVSVTRDLAEASIQEGVNRFVFLSSIKVNGESTEPDRPFTVFDKPNPQDPYGVSKLEAEEALSEFSRASRLAVTVIRPPLVYGPGVGGNFLRLMKLAGSGYPLPLASARNRRSMIFVDNLVDRIIEGLAARHVGIEVAIAADSHPVSTNELVQTISRLRGKPNRLFSLPSGILRFGARIVGLESEYERLFGSLEVSIGSTESEVWIPRISTAEGIAQTLHWFEESQLQERS